MTNFLNLIVRKDCRKTFEFVVFVREVRNIKFKNIKIHFFHSITIRFCWSDPWKQVHQNRTLIFNFVFLALWCSDQQFHHKCCHFVKIQWRLLDFIKFWHSDQHLYPIIKMNITNCNVYAWSHGLVVKADDHHQEVMGSNPDVIERK